MVMKSKVWAWLFTPFKFIAGTKALILGLVVMAVLAILGYYSGTYFNGAIDIHYGDSMVSSVPFVIHLFFQICAWFSLTLSLYVTARIVSKSSVRLIDIAGTLVLSQLPLVIAALWGFTPLAHISFGEVDILNLNIGQLMAVLMENLPSLIVTVVVSTLAIIWSFVLKYNAYSVSANIKGVIGIVSFAVALIVAEIISQILLHFILPLLV